MDECGIERVVNITMQVGDEALALIKRFHSAAPGRFATYAWMDWTDLHRAGFFSSCADRLERMVEHGACGLKVWKDLGTSLRDSTGDLLRVDDERLAPMFEKAAELSVPVMFHTADPDAFFLPVDERNERFEELAAHPDWSFCLAHFGKQELLQQRDRVFARHPRTTFVAAHVAERARSFPMSAVCLKSIPMCCGHRGTISGTGRQPYTAREFFMKHSDRILFGTDLVPEVGMYRLHFRFLETADEYFEYPSHASRQGRWNIYGLFLPDDVLRRVYRENALRLLPR
jgi:predicted TIM-barrel fold metal-dependent hydrolase